MKSSQLQSSPRFRYRLIPARTHRGLWVIAFSLGLVVVVAAMTSDDFPAQLQEAVRSMPVWAGMLGIVGVAVLVFFIARTMQMAREAWLIADGAGIRCSPHKHHGLRAWLRHDWELPWSAIDRAVVLRPGPRARHAHSWFATTLTLESPHGAYKLGLLQWDPVDEPLDYPDLMAFRPGRKMHALTQSHPLIHHLESRGIEVEFRRMGLRDFFALGKPAAHRPDADDEDVPVDLLTYPSLVVMLSLVVGLGAAATLHFTVLPPIRPLWSPAVAGLALAGGVAFAGGSLMARSAPVRERTVVALLLGAVVAALWHPLSVRVHSLLGERPETATYLAAEAGQFRPLDPGLPDLDLSDIDIPEYWDSLAPGDSHPFALQPVGDDGYILHLDPLFERTRAFYSAMDGE